MKLEKRLEEVCFSIHERNGGVRFKPFPWDERFLSGTLNLDSLDLAEVFAVLEIEFGLKPFERKAVPSTWIEILPISIDEGFDNR